MTVFLARPNSAVPGAPSTPVLTATVLGSSSIRLSVAATADAGFKEWAFEYATAALGPFVPVGVQLGSVFDVSPLAPSTQYWFRAKGRTNANQDTAYSNTATGTTGAAIAASAYREPEMPYIAWCQGGSVGLSSGRKAAFAKCDIAVVKEPGPAEYATQASDLAGIHAISPDAKLGVYTDWFFSTDDAESDSGHWRRWVWDVASSVSNWLVKTSGAAYLGHLFAWSTTKCLNTAVHLAGLDGFGRRLSQALAAKFRTIMTSPARLAECSVIPIDDFAVVDQTKSRVDGSDVSPDYEQNGVTDDKYTDTNTSAGGGYKYRTGLAQACADWRAEFPTFGLFVNLNSLEYLQTSPAGVTPILPLTSSELYQCADVALAENGFTYRARIGDHENHSNDHVYPLGAAVGSQEFWADIEIKKTKVRPAATNKFGKPVVAIYAQLAVQSGTTPTSIDYAFARLDAACAAAAGDCGYGALYSGADEPFWLDELAIKHGNRISVGNVFGTLVEGTPCSFTFASASVTGGSSEKFYFVDYEFCRWIIRWDNVGITPGSSNLGAGSSVSCALGSAGTGKRWDAFNATAGNAHPDFPDRVTVGQDTTLNNGAANITTVSLKNYQAQCVLRVAA